MLIILHGREAREYLTAQNDLAKLADRAEDVQGRLHKAVTRLIQTTEEKEPSDAH